MEERNPLAAAFIPGRRILDHRGRKADHGEEEVRSGFTVRAEAEGKRRAQTIIERQPKEQTQNARKKANLTPIKNPRKKGNLRGKTLP